MVKLKNESLQLERGMTRSAQASILPIIRGVYNDMEVKLSLYTLYTGLTSTRRRKPVVAMVIATTQQPFVFPISCLSTFSSRRIDYMTPEQEGKDQAITPSLDASAVETVTSLLIQDIYRVGPALSLPMHIDKSVAS